MAIFDYKTGDLLRFLTQTCPPTEVTALYIYIEKEKEIEKERGSERESEREGERELSLLSLPALAPRRRWTTLHQRKVQEMKATLL